MPSLSLQGRVDSDIWQEIKHPDETTTQALQRVTVFYQSAHRPELLDIAPTYDAAIAVLLHSHQLLNQLAGNSAIALPDTDTASIAEASTATATEPSNKPAWDCADDW